MFLSGSCAYLTTKSKRQFMSSEKDVEEFLEQQELLEGFEIVERLDGHNNQNFIVKSGGEKYVLRKKKDISEDQDTLETERTVLEFMETESVDCAPRSIIYSPEDNIHVISYEGVEDVNVENLRNDDLAVWAKQVAKINQLTFGDYKEFCETNGYSYSEPRTISEEAEKWKNDLDSIEESQRYADLLSFAEEKIRVFEDLETGKESELFGLSHNDIPNSARMGEGRLFLIDWEFSGFSGRPYSDIGAIFAHNMLSEEQKILVKEAYRDVFDVPEDFDNELKLTRNLRHLSSMIWCLGRVSQEKGDTEKYLDYARKQRELYL